MRVRLLFFSNTYSNIMKFLCKTDVFYLSSKNIFFKMSLAKKYLLLEGVGVCQLVVLA